MRAIKLKGVSVTVHVVGFHHSDFVIVDSHSLVTVVEHNLN